MAHTLAQAVEEFLRLYGYNDRTPTAEIERDSSQVAARLSVRKGASVEEATEDAAELCRSLGFELAPLSRTSTGPQQRSLEALAKSSGPTGARRKPPDTEGWPKSIYLKAVHYPDGRTAYPELGILRSAGETLGEALARKKRQLVAQLFQEAMVPVAFSDWHFGSFPLDPAKRPAYQAARSYAQEVRQENLLLIGPPGTGKTGLAICILKARLEQSVPSLFVSVPDLLDKIRATFSGHGEYTQLMEAVKTIDLLLLDDLGGRSSSRSWRTATTGCCPR